MTWNFDDTSDRLERTSKIVDVSLVERGLRVDLNGDVAPTPHDSELSIVIYLDGVSRRAPVHDPWGRKHQVKVTPQRPRGYQLIGIPRSLGAIVVKPNVVRMVLRHAHRMPESPGRMPGYPSVAGWRCPDGIDTECGY